MGISIQQASQIGTEERCGRGESQRAQEAGKRAQPSASMGLRSTRATARQREVSDGGTSNVSDFKSLRKTHLTLGRRAEPSAPLRTSIRGTEEGLHGGAAHADQNSGLGWRIALGLRGLGGLTGVLPAAEDQHPANDDAG